MMMLWCLDYAGVVSYETTLDDNIIVIRQKPPWYGTVCPVV